MSARKKKPDIQLPKITGPRSGMVKKGVVWHALYYEDGKLKSLTTMATTLRAARPIRDRMHVRMVQTMGATYKGDASAKPSVLAAKKNPEGMDCIYTQTSYKVVVAGKTLITTTVLQKAKDVRNEYLNKHF